MILTVLGFAAAFIATLGVITLGIAVIARIKLDLDCKRSKLSFGALILMIATVLCSVAAHGKTEEKQGLKPSLRASRNQQDWAVTLKQLKELKAKIAQVEQLN